MASRKSNYMTQKTVMQNLHMILLGAAAFLIVLHWVLSKVFAGIETFVKAYFGPSGVMFFAAFAALLMVYLIINKAQRGNARQSTEQLLLFSQGTQRAQTAGAAATYKVINEAMRTSRQQAAIDSRNLLGSEGKNTRQLPSPDDWDYGTISGEWEEEEDEENDW